MNRFIIICFIISAIGCNNASKQNNNLIHSDSIYSDEIDQVNVSDSSTNQSNKSVPSIDELNAFKSFVDSISLKSKQGFIPYYKSYGKILDIYGEIKNMFIERYLKEYEAKLDYLNTSVEDLKSLEPYIKDSVHSEKHRAYFYFRMIKELNYVGELRSVLNYDSIINEKYSDFKPNQYDENIQIVKKTFKNIQDLNKSDFLNDYVLWHTGSYYYELFKKVGPITEGQTYDMTYPFTYYDSLINLYPNSEYSDNALFIEISHYDYPEPCDNSADYYIPKYKEILSSYPDTDCKPMILEKICLHYYSYCECIPKDNCEKLELSKEYANKLFKEFPDYPNNKRLQKLFKDIDD